MVGLFFLTKKTKLKKGEIIKLKYLSIRIKSKKTNQLNHDTRKQNINYLRNSNDNIYFDSDFNQYQFNNKNVQEQNKYIKIVQKDLEEYKEIMIEEDKSFIENHNQDLTENQKRRRSSIQRNTNYFNSGIITFSESMKKDFENDKEGFISRLKDFKEDFEKEHGTKIINMSIHLDEKTPHVHFDFINYDNNKNKTLLRNIQKQGLRDLQDLGDKHYNNFGLGYHRGKSSDITKSKNMNVSQSHKIEIFKNKINDILKDTQADLKELNQLRATLRQETKETTDNTLRTTNKVILKELTKEINQHKKLFKILEKKIIQSINKNTFIKTDKEELAKDLMKVFNISNQIKLNKRIEEVQELNLILQLENEKLNNDSQNIKINLLKETIKSKNEHIETLSNKNRELEIKNNDLSKSKLTLESDINNLTKSKEITKSKIIKSDNDLDKNKGKRI